MKRIAIVGCRPPPRNPSKPRAWHEANAALYEKILANVDAFCEALGDNAILVTGGAIGVDSRAMEHFGYFIVHRPDYGRYDAKRAPLERNTLIVRDAFEVHAWPAPWSRGTWDTINKAKAAGKPVTVHEVKP